MLSSIPLSLAVLLLALSPNAIAVPRPPSAGQLSIPLIRRSPQRDDSEWAEWAKNERESLMTKYGSNPTKRSAGTNLITNQNADSSFFGTVAIGTPATAFDVILDTGSADLWIAASTCTVGCGRIATYNIASSSTFKNLSSAFAITYGSGQAAGSLGQDVVQMAGFSVDNQVFGVVDAVSNGLLNNPVSGLLGLAFQTIAASGAAPMWETLAASGKWDQPLMSFQLTRFINASNPSSLEPGGTFTMGFTNASLFTGTIDYQNLPGTPSYWLLPMTSLTVNSNAISLDTGTSSYSAIDTGTTLVGGPANAIKAIYAQIPGAAPGTGSWTGYYTYPCSTIVNVAISFGGPSWPVSPADFKLATLTNGQCVGAFFELNTSGSAPAWIVGDTFLKNVYSVFRYNPPSVGFAALSDVALAMNGANGPPPSATIGTAAATVTASGIGNGVRETGVGKGMGRVVLVGSVVVGAVMAVL